MKVLPNPSLQPTGSPSAGRSAASARLRSTRFARVGAAQPQRWAA